MDDQNKRSTLETNYCLFEYNIGSAFSLDNDILLDNISTIQHGYSDSSGAGVALKHSAIAMFVKAVFYNNTSAKNGGVASLSYESEFLSTSCVLIGNIAENAGGIANAELDSFFIIENSKI
ncbi:unnamed protein product [Blepharisma stoltei]|uniref:Uncharacterized protein n=1 Tax=Blepharisma stoltei TaxID=1481888 RepID=A0AAU9JCK7_9CILI|nr:unnamed protein product [Blepharisma stoltei]